MTFNKSVQGKWCNKIQEGKCQIHHCNLIAGAEKSFLDYFFVMLGSKITLKLILKFIAIWCSKWSVELVIKPYRFYEQKYKICYCWASSKYKKFCQLVPIKWFHDWEISDISWCVAEWSSRPPPENMAMGSKPRKCELGFM
jgi:hypothetical protein